jgi:hypothetical protein
MTWSKASTTTNSFMSGAGNFGDNNVLVIDEYIDYLVTRGWVLDKEEVLSDVPDTGDRTWSWQIYKIAVCEDGGSSEWGYKLFYVEDTSIGTDDIRLYAWDRASNTLGGGMLTNVYVSTNDGIIMSGKWSFWESDLDSDSFFVMAEETSQDQIIGFWPPEGTMHKQGGGAYNIKSGGIKIISDSSFVYGNASNNANTSMEFPWGASGGTYLQAMNPQNMKLDLCLGHIAANAYRRIFSSYGGDIHSYLSFTQGFQCLSTIPQYNETNVYLIDGKYYIAWGYQSKMLFDCGATAPVF